MKVFRALGFIFIGVRINYIIRYKFIARIGFIPTGKLFIYFVFVIISVFNPSVDVKAEIDDQENCYKLSHNNDMIP